MKKNGLQKTGQVSFKNGSIYAESGTIYQSPLEKFHLGLPLTEEESWKVDEYWTENLSYLAGMFVPREG